MKKQFLIDKENLEKIGKLCDCSIKKIEDYICPCKDFREKSICICGVFKQATKKEY